MQHTPIPPRTYPPYWILLINLTVNAASTWLTTFAQRCALEDNTPSARRKKLDIQGRLW